jgi:hypothetical protein
MAGRAEIRAGRTEHSRPRRPRRTARKGLKWDADELCIHAIQRWAHHAIAMSTHVHERYMRRALGIAQCAGLRNVTTLPGADIERVTNAMPTGAKPRGGRDFVATPAQKLWRSTQVRATARTARILHGFVLRFAPIRALCFRLGSQVFRHEPRIY